MEIDCKAECASDKARRRGDASSIVDRDATPPVCDGADDFLQKDDIDGPQLARSFRYAIERHEINAAEAIAPGNTESNRVRISVTEQNSDVVVAISDTGSGITDEHLERLFEPFFTTKKASKGTGLGLPISQHIVNQHGGRIEVDTTVGQGTTMSVILPI